MPTLSAQVSASSQLQQEEAEWETLNTLLLRHGMEPLSIAASPGSGSAPGKECRWWRGSRAADLKS